MGLDKTKPISSGRTGTAGPCQVCERNQLYKQTQFAPHRPEKVLAAGASGVIIIGGQPCETKPIRTTGGAGGMRKAPKRGHRVTNRTLKHVGPPVSQGLLAWETRTHTAFIDSHGANVVCVIDGFLAMSRYNRSMVLARPPYMGLTLPFFPDSSPGPAGAFLTGNYPIQNTHGTAEPCGCSPAKPVVNGITICSAAMRPHPKSLGAQRSGPGG